MEDVNKQRQNFASLSKLECGPQEINCMKIRLSLDNFSELVNTRQSLKKREFKAS